MNNSNPVSDFTVIGTGPAGLAAALALAHLGVNGRIAGPRPPSDPDKTDKRTTAIFNGGIVLLQRLGLWGECRAHVAPLEAIRIIDDTGRLFRAPETLFKAKEVGAKVFGYNIPNADLVATLFQTLNASDRIEYIETKAVTAIKPLGDHVLMQLAEDRQIRARLVAGADGRRSLARKAANIAPHRWDYDQAAVVCCFDHSRPHENISTEFHRPGGPLTTVPLPGNSSSLVWVERKARAAALADLGDEAFVGELEQRLGGVLGSISALTPRGHFPLSGMSARQFAANRIALIGEAAHIVPPIGAQGLNLGLRDGAALADCVADALADGRDPGGRTVMDAYNKARRGDIFSRTAAIDLLNRTLLSDLLPAQMLRGGGLHALGLIAPLKQFVMREGIQPGRSLPRLMRPIAP